jgi:hypothetical protein
MKHLAPDNGFLNKNCLGNDLILHKVTAVTLCCAMMLSKIKTLHYPGNVGKQLHHGC